MKPTAALIALLSCVLVQPAFATVPGANPELDRLYSQARGLLDGPRTGFQAAVRLLQTILERDPEYAAAYVEAARYSLKSSYRQTINGRDVFDERGLEEATRLLDHAIELEPAFAETFVLYGYVLRAQDRSMLGLTALAEAERLGSSNNWLSYNRAFVLESLERMPAARLEYLTARDAAERGSAQHLQALEGLTRVGRSAEEVDSSHRELIELQPSNAWASSEYARFLLSVGRIDAAIEQARAALAIEPIDNARARLAVALYAKASALLLDQRDAVRATEYFTAAESTGYPPRQALILAAAYDATFIAVLGLHERGVDINAADEFGRSALFFALQSGHLERVRQLLDRDARTEIRDRAGWTPLMLAVDAGSLPLVEMLLAAGADPNFLGPDNRSPVEAATRAGHTAIVARLTAAGVHAAEEPWRAIAGAARDGSPAGLDRAIRYLQFEEPENAGVLLALQEALIADPVRVVELAAEFGFVLNKICGTAAPAAGAPAAARRLDALQRRYGSTGPPPPTVATCMAELARAETEPQLPSTAAPLTSAARSELLATARSLFEESRRHELKRSRATELAHVLYADPKDAHAHLLVAEIQFANVPTDAALDASSVPGSIESTVTALERALTANEGYADAFAFYGHVLRFESHHGLADVMLRRAASLGNAGPWLAVYQAEASIAAGDVQGAVRRLEGIDIDAGPRRLRAAALQQLLEVFRGDGQTARVRDTFERLVAVDPEDTEPLRHYFFYLLHDDANFDKAVEVGTRINNIGGNVDDNGWLAVSMFAKGARLLAQGGTVTDAARHFKQGRRLVDRLDPLVARTAAYPSTFFVLKTLRDAGLSVNVTDETYTTPLINAVARGDPAAVAELLSLGADVNMPGTLGETPLQLAVIRGDEAIALQLVAAGADSLAGLPDGSSLADVAFERDMQRLRSRLTDVGLGRYPDWDTFLRGVEAAQPVHVRRALTLAAQPDVRLALESALRVQARTLVELVNEGGELGIVCGKSTETDPARRERSVRARIDAASKARDLQVALDLAPSSGVLERCLALFALEAARQ